MPPEQLPVDNSPEFEALLLQNDENAQVNQNQLDSLLMQGEEGNSELKSINQTIKEDSDKVKKVQIVPSNDENELATTFFKMLRGPKGEDGYTPEKGKDYYTKEEIAEVVKEIQDSIRIPEDGIDGYTPVRGEDYFTDEDISSMVDDVFSRIPTPKDGKDAEVDYEMVISECIARIPKPKNGKNGKNSAEMTSEQILDKIRGLLSYNDLKDLPTLWKNVASRDYDLVELKDVSVTSPTNGQVLKYNSTSRKWENGTDNNSPGGSDTQVQFNDGGAFGGDAGFSYNKTTDTLTVGGGLVVDTSTFVVDATNNRVGIGTATPLFQTHSETGSSKFNFVARRGDTSNGEWAGIGLGITTNSSALAIKGAVIYERTGSNGVGSLHLCNNNTADTSNAAVADAKLTITTTGLIGLGTTAPTHTLTLPSTSTGIALYNTADQTTNYERLLISYATNTLTFDSQKGGSGSVRNIAFHTNSNSGGSVTITTSTSASQPGLNIDPFTSGLAGITTSSGSDRTFRVRNSNSGNVLKFSLDGLPGASSGTQVIQEIVPTVSQSATAGYTCLLINPTESSTGSGNKRLISAQVGGTDKFVVDNAGHVTAEGVTSTGATGTGKFVFDTSPALVTPTLGTATATVLKYASEVDNGNSGAADTIDWSLGNIQKSTITAGCTYTFSNPFLGHMTLRIIQDGTGNFTATLPAGKWTSGIVPLIKDTANKWTIVNIYYDGSAYSYSLNQNLS